MTRSARLLRAMILGFGMWAFGLTATKAGQAASPSMPEHEVRYGIPAQTLAGALNAYAAASSVQVLYETSLVAGRKSASVSGDLAPSVALQRLLAGTGLVARQTDVDAVTVVPADREAALRLPSGDEQTLMAALQVGILDALCKSELTRPGNFRIALQLWINPVGTVRHAVLLGSTGDFRRDDALVLALRRVTLAGMAPAKVAQPVTMVIAPRGRDQPRECGPPE